MVSVREAFEILEALKLRQLRIKIELREAVGYVLAEEVSSPADMPSFPQSAMDGFAVNIHESLSYTVVGEAKAGDGAFSKPLAAGQAVQIFTGAIVPKEAQAVIQIEECHVEHNSITLNTAPSPGSNIRPVGEQCKQGDVVMRKGTPLNSAAIGFLAGMGFTSVEVWAKPTVGVIVTGNELAKPGAVAAYGQVYESNGIMLETALEELTVKAFEVTAVKDDLLQTKEALSLAFERSDVVVVSGGISVGAYDFVYEALKDIGVEPLFYKVRQKPGKPIFVGQRRGKLVFALPGNPASCLTCFHIYTKPVLRKMMGYLPDFRPTCKKPLAQDLEVNDTRDLFLKAWRDTNDEVHVLSHQNSSMLRTYYVANCLIYLPLGNYSLKKGQEVNIYWI